jgi:hypothetical protein
VDIDVTLPDHLSFDPPPGCSRPLLWFLARYLLEAHVPAVDGLCCLCRPAEINPCPARRLATAGLRASCGEAHEPAGAAWLDVVRRRLATGELDPGDAVAEAMWLAHRQRSGCDR